MNRPASDKTTFDQWGVALGYEDALGQWQATGEQARTALREILGPTEAIEGRSSTAPLVVRQGQAISLPEPSEIQLEDGASMAVDAALPPHLPPGYHQLHASGKTRRLIVAPPRCYLPDNLLVWGWSAQLYSTRSEQSWGIGDLADLARLGRWSSSLGASILLVNPLAADTPVEPQQASPYSPSSRCFRNILYLAVEQVPGALQLGAVLEKAMDAGRALDAGPRIDRNETLRLKLSVLRPLWDRFGGSGAFDRYRQEQGKLLADFCRFSALAEKFGRDWRSWPAEYRNPSSSAVDEFARHNTKAVDFHAWLQWLLDEQLARAAAEIGLMQDLPIGVDPAGADAWMWQDTVASGVSVGAPPDKYNPAGQDWALAAFSPHALRRANYEPFIQTIRAALRYAGGLRIDHVMGLVRLYWIPSGAGAAGGAYVHYPADDLLAILALESHRARAFIVGEDLGTLDLSARETFAANGMLSYRLLWFEDDQPKKYPRQALAAVTTHDLPTIAGLWTGDDERDLATAGVQSSSDGWRAIRNRLKRRTRLSAETAVEEVVRRAYRHLAQAPSIVLTASLEDAMAVRHRPNMPGTIDTWPNWSQAIPGGIEALEQSPLARAIADEFNHAKLPRTKRSG